MNLAEAQHAIEPLLLDVVKSDVAVLQDASQHIISAGGKRVRPTILFHAYLATGGTDLAYTVPVAAALELVHTATLVHDDINDHGVMRRGRVTINEKWGRTFALLTGDYLFTKVYSLMAPYAALNVAFAEATVALVEGETLQAQAAKEGTLNRDIYQKIVAKKTASLFRAAGLLGAELAGAPRNQVDALGEYGFYLGLAFQIVDDLLDLIGDPRIMGKEAGVDVAQGKGVAAAHAHGNGAPSVEALAPSADDEGHDPIVALKQRLAQEGAVEEGRRMAQALAQQAETALNKLPAGESIEELRTLLHYVVNRDH